jgi:homoserine kinase type II
VEQTTRSVAGAAAGAIRALEPWENVALRCQPCLRDLRGEHVLFTSTRVTGLVDYGAMAIDHPAVDLARLLGDFAEERDDLFDAALRAYREAGGEIETSVEFLTQLARTGALGSAINWLRRLRNVEVRHLGIERAEARLSLLLRRIERFAPG